jgi:excisionase family DNA binding protein
MDIVNSDNASSILTMQDIAEYLRVHPSTIYRLLKKNQLPPFKVGTRGASTRR